METLEKLKAKLLVIIDEYKVVSKAKAKEFSNTATVHTIKDYHFVVKDEQPSKSDKDNKWIGKRTITKVESKDIARYENIYAEALDTNAQPVLISPANGDGELPATAKDAKDKNLLDLIAKLKEIGSNTCTVGLIWDIANPHDKPNPNPQEFPYYEIVDSDFKETEKGQKWTAKRTISKKTSPNPDAKNVYKNVYTSALVGGQPKTLNGEGDLPNSAKSRSGKNFVHLMPKMKGGTLVVDLVWDGKPSDDEVQKAMNIVNSFSLDTYIYGHMPVFETNVYPSLADDRTDVKTWLNELVAAILVLKRAGFTKFSISFTLNVGQGTGRMVTGTELQTVVDKFCTEIIRGVVKYSKGTLKESEFIFSAQAIVSLREDAPANRSTLTPLR